MIKLVIFAGKSFQLPPIRRHAFKIFINFVCFCLSPYFWISCVSSMTSCCSSVGQMWCLPGSSWSEWEHLSHLCNSILKISSSQIIVVPSECQDCSLHCLCSANKIKFPMNFWHFHEENMLFKTCWWNILFNQQFRKRVLPCNE